jgi:hypothetical protein
MAKFSMKKGGKEVGPASVYAQPHDMSGKKMTQAPVEPHDMSGSQVDLGYKDGTNPGFGENRSKLETADISLGQFSKSAGNEPIKTDGIKMRGTGCATKGTMSRGPMA